MSIKIFNMTRGMVKSEEELLQKLKSLVCEKTSKVVKVVEFRRLRQKTTETISDWVARVQGKAELCEFLKPCDCGSGISYLEDMVLGQVLIGLQNEEWLGKC